MKSRYLLLIIAVSTLAVINCAKRAEIEVSRTVRYGDYMKFTPQDSCLTMNIYHKPVEQLRNKVQEVEKVTLQGDGKPQIVLITPWEYHNVLKPYLSIAEINLIAKKFRIQKAKLNLMCLGRGRTEIKGDIEKTYFIVVESKDLDKIRRKIYDAYVKKGGEPSHFDPFDYRPHIPLGFTARELGETDGVKKGWNSCFASLRESD